MRVLASLACGGPETLAVIDLPIPQIGADDVLIRVETCGINYPDVLVIEDRYQARPARPFAPGGEVAGVVAEVGANVIGFAPGDRVAALTLLGGLAEYACCPASLTVKLPSDAPGAEAAMLLATYSTAFHALVDRGGVQAGDTVLVLGASGGVGLAAVELAGALGARVVGAASSADKAAAVRRAGAAECLLLEAPPADKAAQRALADRFKQAAPDGFDIVYDPVGGDAAEPALRSLAWGGRYLAVGFVAGIPRVPLNLPLLKGAAILGVFMGAFAQRFPERYAANLARLFAMHGAGLLHPQISARYALARGGAAIAALRDRKVIGKVVVDVAAP